MSFREQLTHIVDLASPYWAGEEEIAWTYFQSPQRTTQSDLRWLERQCYKEIWGSGVADGEGGLFLGPLERLRDVFAHIDRGVDRYQVLDMIEGLRSEFHHYCLFADVHDELSGGHLDPSRLAGWPADDELARLRVRARAEHGRLGHAAVLVTEGGYGSFYAAGIRLAGSSALNDRIASACRRVYDDEISHMRQGLVDLARMSPALDDWQTLAELIAGMLLQRLHMRNEQLGRPVSQHRIDAIQRGEIEPAAFDYSGLENLA